ncbi:hypothetical protein niasHT_034111 [Heterodera trifolii]|uniref:Secreted protein n=1 Tax=Heterodera trifolii TaxID=157864 RepID=A0ABD2J2U7_9BILA
MNRCQIMTAFSLMTSAMRTANWRIMEIPTTSTDLRLLICTNDWVLFRPLTTWAPAFGQSLRLPRPERPHRLVAAAATNERRPKSRNDQEQMDEI